MVGHGPAAPERPYIEPEVEGRRRGVARNVLVDGHGVAVSGDGRQEGEDCDLDEHVS